MGHGGTCPHVHEWLGTGGTVSNKSVGHIVLFSCMAQRIALFQQQKYSMRQKFRMYNVKSVYTVVTVHLIKAGKNLYSALSWGHHEKVGEAQ